MLQGKVSAVIRIFQPPWWWKYVGWRHLDGWQPGHAFHDLFRFAAWRPSKSHKFLKVLCNAIIPDAFYMACILDEMGSILVSSDVLVCNLSINFSMPQLGHPGKFWDELNQVDELWVLSENGARKLLRWLKLMSVCWECSDSSFLLPYLTRVCPLSNLRPGFPTLSNSHRHFPWPCRTQTRHERQNSSIWKSSPSITCIAEHSSLTWDPTMNQLTPSLCSNPCC